MELIINDKLKLKSLTIEDTAPLFEIINTDREYFRQYLNWPDMPEDLAATQAFVANKIERFEQGLGPHFSILYQNKVVGMGGYHEMDLTEKVGSVGCWLGSEYINKGLATTAASRVIQLGFEHYGLDRVEIKCTADNLASQVVAKRLGFTLVETIKDGVEMNGQLQDVVVYSMLAEHLRS